MQCQCIFNSLSQHRWKPANFYNGTMEHCNRLAAIGPQYQGLTESTTSECKRAVQAVASVLLRPSVSDHNYCCCVPETSSLRCGQQRARYSRASFRCSGSLVPCRPPAAAGGRVTAVMESAPNTVLRVRLVRGDPLLAVCRCSARLAAPVSHTAHSTCTACLHAPSSTD